ncbi:MAG TPA: hypothetical protein VFW89_03180 [Gemmatimonadaceae bacterium]|nr:hypothetical protein [Gemmatimonadaceae bacterium]
MTEQPSLLSTPGDLEAVILAESFDLLGKLIAPYMYRVSGDPGQQQALFASSEVQDLFYIGVHEFLADATRVSSSPGVPSNLSLLSGGGWLCKQHPERAARAGLIEAHTRATSWFATVHRIVFWAPDVCRHLRLELPMTTIVAMRANLEKHQLLRLTTEIRRLRSKLAQSGCALSIAETVAARPDFDDHIRGMLEYHSTEVAEHLGRYFLALYHFVREIYLERPTNNLDALAFPSDVSDEIFRYMYVSTVFRLSGWTEQRIVSSTPETAPSFKATYPQHRDWDIVESERGDV